MKFFPCTLSTFLMTARRGTSHAESLVFWAYTTYFFRLLRQLRAWFKKLVQHNLTNQSEHANFFVDLAPVVQKLDNAIHRINHYPADKC